MDGLELRQGYRPGLIGALTRLHAEYYHHAWGFDHSFEVQVASQLAEFVGRFQPGRDVLLSAWRGPELAGALAVDHAAGEPGLRLRWLIVDRPWRGGGLGPALLERAMRLALEPGPARVYLYTFRGLEAAKTLYTRAGFYLAKEHAAQQWGASIIEQLYETRPPGQP